MAFILCVELSVEGWTLVSKMLSLQWLLNALPMRSCSSGTMLHGLWIRTEQPTRLSGCLAVSPPQTQSPLRLAHLLQTSLILPSMLIFIPLLEIPFPCMLMQLGGKLLRSYHATIAEKLDVKLWTVISILTSAHAWSMSCKGFWMTS